MDCRGLPILQFVNSRQSILREKVGIRTDFRPQERQDPRFGGGQNSISAPTHPYKQIRTLALYQILYKGRDGVHLTPRYGQYSTGVRILM